MCTTTTEIWCALWKERCDMASKTAWINWSDRQDQWVLRLFDDGWRFDNAWDVDHQGEDEDGDPIDFVSDSILCEIARLQDEGYEVKVTLNGDYRQ